MKRALLIAGGLLLGLLAAEYLTTQFGFRAWLGRFVRRGELVALVGRRGIYESDLRRAGGSQQALADEYKLTETAAQELVSGPSIEQEMSLLRWQFPDDKTWDAALARAALTTGALREEVTTSLRDRAWLEAKLAPFPPPSDAEIRQFYEEHRERFAQPLRLRASHLFLAAPDGYPPEVIETKKKSIESLAKRLGQGESFNDLVAEFSEDEATKNRDGDLNYFDAARMLPEIFAAAQTLRPGETSAPIRSRLGFHLLRLTEARPARELTLAEAQPEIEAALENERRGRAVDSLVATLREQGR